MARLYIIKQALSFLLKAYFSPKDKTWWLLALVFESVINVIESSFNPSDSELSASGDNGQ